MAKARSPQYPSIGLKEAVEKIEAVYKKDYQNRVPREVVAKHMGYDSLHGKALGVLSTLGKFGLLEGRANETRVSDLAVTIIAHEPGPERAAALREAAAKPDLFADLDKRFPDGRFSDAAIRSYLLTQKFIPSAADAAIRSYRETKQLVESESAGYPAAQPEPDESPMQPQTESGSPITGGPPTKPITASQKMAVAMAQSERDQPDAPGIRKEVITLDEGDVVVSFPDNLSADSVGDLEARLGLFLKRLQRKAGQA